MCIPDTLPVSLYIPDSAVRRRIPSTSLFRTNKYGMGKEGKPIDPESGVRGRNGKRVNVKHNGKDGTENGFVKISGA